MNDIIQDIITKRILEEASSEELVILEKWRSESQYNENLYKEYSAIWDASAKYTSVDFKPKTESAYQKHLALLAKEESSNESKVVRLNTNTNDSSTLNQSSTKFFTLKNLSSIAALFVIAMGAMIVFNKMSNTSFTAEDGVTFASLEDGSSVWLDEGSSLTYTKGFGKNHRDVKLEGKAFFEVNRNEDLVFNIASNDINVAVLGTSFTVDTKAGKNIVSVKTGKVQVNSADKKISLEANQKVEFVNNSFYSLKNSSEDVTWRNRELSFNNAPLNQVISDINLFHNNKIVLDSEGKSLDCPFTARSLANTSFENIIKILKVTYDIEVENKENGNVILSISDCK